MAKDLKPYAHALIAASCAEFEALSALLPPEGRAARGTLAQWSPKDEIAHLSYWIGLFASNLAARRTGQPLTDTRPYLALNDAAWETRKDWAWDEVERSIAQAFADVEAELAPLSAEELIDGARLSVEPERTPPRPVLRSLLYEVIDHPLHHFMGLYAAFATPEQTEALLTRLAAAVAQPGTSRWSATTRGKIKQYGG